MKNFKQILKKTFRKNVQKNQHLFSEGIQFKKKKTKKTKKNNQKKFKKVYMVKNIYSDINQHNGFLKIRYHVSSMNIIQK